ncbi:hypothetical protein ACJZ2D_002659 [Fusarium nematophilum]
MYGSARNIMSLRERSPPSPAINKQKKLINVADENTHVSFEKGDEYSDYANPKAIWPTAHWYPLEEHRGEDPKRDHLAHHPAEIHIDRQVSVEPQRSHLGRRVPTTKTSTLGAKKVDKDKRREKDVRGKHDLSQPSPIRAGAIGKHADDQPDVAGDGQGQLPLGRDGVRAAGELSGVFWLWPW